MMAKLDVPNDAIRRAMRLAIFRMDDAEVSHGGGSRSSFSSAQPNPIMTSESCTLI